MNRSPHAHIADKAAITPDHVPLPECGLTLIMTVYAFQQGESDSLRISAMSYLVWLQT